MVRRPAFPHPQGNPLATREPTAERILAYAMPALLAVELMYKDFPVTSLLAVALLPITLPALRRYRGGVLLFSLTIAATISGMLLTRINASTHETDVHRMLAKSFLILGIGVCCATLLWARSIIGIAHVALSYGVGSALGLSVSGISAANAWKFSLSIPTVLILLSIPIVARSRVRQLIVLIGIAAASAILDSRSLAATLLIAAALLLTRRRKNASRATSSWLVVAQLAIVGVGGYFAIQGAILEGVLGEEIQARSEAQIDTSGSLITGGRPELGATIALVRANPFGFGSGTTPAYQDIQTAKTGMSALGYDPENGYVNNYMFGSSFEVHSLTGDLWLLAGIAGTVLAICVFASVVGGMAHGISNGTILAVALFLGVRTVWDTFFSPILSTYFTVGLSLALLLPALRPPSSAEDSPNWFREQSPLSSKVSG